MTKGRLDKMPKDRNEELDKVYNRINTLESKVDSTNGYLKGVVESNEKLIALLEKRDTSMGRVITALIVLLLFSLAVIAYGAIGDKGMKTVRETMPSVPQKADAIPAPNDVDKWANNLAKAPHK